jgi:hypothetical protein
MWHHQYRSNVDEKGVVREDYGIDRDMQPFASVIGIYLLVYFFITIAIHCYLHFVLLSHYDYLITTKYYRQTASVLLLLLLSLLEYLYTLWRTHIFTCHTKYTIFFSNHKGFLLGCRMARRI